MARNGGHLTLVELVFTYALFAGSGWLAFGAAGLWAGLAVVTALWGWAVCRAAWGRPARGLPSDEGET